MTASTTAGAAGLIREALEVYADDPLATKALRGHPQRLAEPLRIAIAGMVKAGKSTLLNAIMGEEIAPTDTGECTRMPRASASRCTALGCNCLPRPAGRGGWV